MTPLHSLSHLDLDKALGAAEAGDMGRAADLIANYAESLAVAAAALRRNAETAPRSTPPAPDRTTAPATAVPPEVCCPSCSARLEPHKCKQVCRRCGYFDDCGIGPA